MLGAKYFSLFVLLFITAELFSTVVPDSTEIDYLDGNDTNGIPYNFSNMVLLSVMKQTETIQEIKDKSFELKLYSKKEGLEEEANNTASGKSLLIAKLLISEATKVLKNGEQIGNVIVSNQTIVFDGDEIQKPSSGSEYISETVKEEHETGNATSFSVPGSETVETAVEKEPAEEVEEPKETEAGNESSLTSSQPSTILPSKVTTMLDLPETNSSSFPNANDTILDQVTSALVSSAITAYGSFSNHLLLLLPICIGLRLH